MRRPRPEADRPEAGSGDARARPASATRRRPGSRSRAHLPPAARSSRSLRANVGESRAPAERGPRRAPRERGRQAATSQDLRHGRLARRARLRLTRIDPWSVMKTSFLLSVAFGVVTLVGGVHGVVGARRRRRLGLDQLDRRRTWSASEATPDLRRRELPRHVPGAGLHAAGLGASTWCC